MGADEFRDYILGFIFFKFLSERMESFANDILEGEDFKIMKAKKKYNKGGSVDPEKEKAKKAAEAEAKKRLQDKMRKVYGDVTESSKEAVSRSSERAKQSGKPLSEGQKQRAVSKQRKLGNVLEGSLKESLSPQEKLQNIKADLRNLQSGKEELVYVGRPDRYGVDADLKNKPIGRVYDEKKSTLKLRKYKKGGKNKK